MPETFLASGPLSLDECVSAVRTQAKDESGNPVWTDSEIKLAIRQAILNSSGRFFLTQSTTLSFANGTFEYALAADVQRVIYVLRQRTGVDANPLTLSGISTDETITSWRHFNMRGDNTLIFTRDYQDGTMTLYYERDVQIPIENRTANGSHTSAITTLTLVNADPQLWKLSLPAWFKWDNEIIKVTAISGNTSATIARAQLGTTAASHADGSEISQLLMADTDRFYNFLFAETGRLLNEWRIQSGSGNVDVSANITAARFFRENRDLVTREISQTRRTRKMHFSRERRPRRGTLYYGT